MILIIIVGVIVSIYFLKEQFIRKNPFVRGRSVAGLFFAPVLQIACTGGLLYDALHLNIVDSYSGWGIFFSLINELQGSGAESTYYESAETYASVAKICFLVTICSAGYLLFKLFDDSECNKSLMNILIGIGTVTCSVIAFYCGNFLLSSTHYFGEYSKEYPIVPLLAIIAFYLCAWYYFNVSLKDVLSSSAVDKNEKHPGNAQKETTMIDKTQSLLNLKSLLDSGVLTQEEFNEQKHKILNS